jgi:23S rRNA pseudouridine2605 synthase
VNVPEPDLAKTEMRLNRYIARCGAASRRDADKLIEGGRIAVNGNSILEPGTRITPGTDIVTLDGSKLELPGLVYYKCYKPIGVLTTLDDTHGRKSVLDLMEGYEIPNGVVPAGRLDKDSEGLLILTNDGDLVQRLTHPGYGVRKVYRVLINRRPNETDLDKIRSGVQCEEFFAKALKVTRLGPQPRDNEHPEPGYWLEMILGEGKKREIREMMKVTGYRVIRLVRISHGPIGCGALKPGEIKPLNDPELAKLLIKEF